MKKHSPHLRATPLELRRRAGVMSHPGSQLERPRPPLPLPLATRAATSSRWTHIGGWGGRAGLAIGTSPGGFWPYHAELRAAYGFVPAPNGGWLRPYLSGAAGTTEVQARVPLQVEDPAPGSVITARTYRQVGRGFISAGAGLELALFDALSLDASLGLGFPYRIRPLCWLPGWPLLRCGKRGLGELRSSSRPADRGARPRSYGGLGSVLTGLPRPTGLWHRELQ